MEQRLMEHLEAEHRAELRMRFLVEPGRSTRRFAPGTASAWALYHVWLHQRKGDLEPIELLKMTLQLAVPLRIFELQTFRAGGGDIAARCGTWARESADAVAHNGDLLQFKSPKKGGSAAVFNALAKGVAAGAFTPGGLNAFGLVWCEKHWPGGQDNMGDLGPCRSCFYEGEIDLALENAGPSLLEALRDALDRIVARLMRPEASEKDGGPKQDGRDPGRAEGLAFAIALITNPYKPDMDQIRKEAMERWESAQQEEE